MELIFRGTAKEVRDEMREMLGLGGMVTGEQYTSEFLRNTPEAQAEPEVEKPKGRGRGKSTAQTGTSGNATGASAGEASEASGAPTANGGVVSRDDVGKLCMQYGQPAKGGAAALQELFREFGAPNGKWSEVTDDKLPALKVRLDELLTA